MDFSHIQELRERIQAGENSVYKELLQVCGSYCINRLRHKTNCSVEDAEDILMDAILIFRDNMLSGKIQSLSSIKAYIFAICWNKWQEAYRKKQKHLLATHTIRRELYDSHSNVEENWLEQVDSPFQDSPLDHYRKLSQEALSLLGQKCQAILRFFYIEEKSMAEIASLLGYANAQTTKNLKARCYKRWIHHARELLKEGEWGEN